MPSTGSKFILAIDLGTSAAKLALVSTRGEVLGGEEEPLELQLLPGGGAEQSPEQWWTAIVRGTRRLLARGLAPVEHIVGLNCSSQWSGTVAVDEAGQPLWPALLWMDSRGAPHVQRLAGGFPSLQGYSLLKALTWMRLTGGAPSLSGRDPVGHILFLRHEHPEVYRRAWKFLEPKDWLNLRLTGRCVASHDSITLHWVTDNRDLSRIAYDERLLRLSGLAREQLPELVPAASVLGPLQPAAASALGLGEQVQVVVGMPDALAAAVGSGAVRDYEPHLCVGTSSWLSCHVPFKRVDPIHNMASLPSALPDRYLLLNEQQSAGICLTYLKDILAEGDSYHTLEQAAERVPPGSEGVIFMPWLNGERSPVDDRLVRGGFFNQSLRTTRGHLVRAVLEGVAFNARWLLTHVEQFLGRRLQAIRVIGGGVRSRLWCQILADVLDRPMQQVDEPVLANARGAAFQAAVALGHLRVEEIPALVPLARTWEPDPSRRRLYDELFPEFLNLYKCNKAIFARLNRARSA